MKMSIVLLTLIVRNKKEKRMKTKAKKQMEKFFELHVRYFYTVQKFVEAAKENPLAFKTCSDVEIRCPFCGQKSIVANLPNLDEFKCTNSACGFELNIEKIMEETIKTKKGIENHV